MKSENQIIKWQNENIENLDFEQYEYILMLYVFILQQIKHRKLFLKNILINYVYQMKDYIKKFQNYIIYLHKMNIYMMQIIIKDKIFLNKILLN